MTVSITVDDLWLYLTGNGLPLAQIDLATSYLVHNRWFMKTYREGLWDGRKRFRRYSRAKRWHKLPAGFLPRVCAVLDRCHVPYTIEDKRYNFDVPVPDYELLDPDRGSLRLDQGKYSFQKDALEAACTEGRGIIQMPTGAGKTIVGAAIIKTFSQRAVWLTHRRLLAHQARAVLETRLGRRIGYIGEGQVETAPVTVAMVQTLAKRKNPVIGNFLRGVGVVISDEAHHVTGGEFADCMGRCLAPHRFGLTATPHLQAGGMALVGHMGEVIYSVEPSELIARGVLVEPRIWFCKLPETVQLKRKTPWPTAYARLIVDNPWRNEQIALCARMFAEEKKPTLILVARKKHGAQLRLLLEGAGLEARFLEGADSQERRQRALEDLRTGKNHAVVAMAQLFGEGFDAPWLKAVINATGLKGGGSKSNKNPEDSGRSTIQFIGRGLRAAEGKDGVDYVDFFDSGHKTLLTASLERARTLEEAGYGPFMHYWSQREAIINPEMVV